MARIEDFFDTSVDAAVREVVEAFGWATIEEEDVCALKQMVIDIMWKYRPEEAT